MAFNPINVTYPTPNLQHMFSGHKADWGYANVNWNAATEVNFRNTLTQFIVAANNAGTVFAGTYHAQDAWLAVNMATRNCAIIYRPGYQIWSGWTLSVAQSQYATNPPYSLGGGAIAVFGNILEAITRTESHTALSELTSSFFDAYRAHGTDRYDEASENTLIDFFAALDNYIPPEMALIMPAQSGHIQALDEVKERARRTLAVLEKNA